MNESESIDVFKCVAPGVEPVVIFGEEGQGGTYLLRMRLGTEIALAFGRFRGGRVFTLPAGEYVYLGSALNARGATSLAPRLLRHATRAEGPPHAIRVRLWEGLRAHGLGSSDLHPPETKRLRWNVDYFLEAREVDLMGVYAIRSGVRLETALGRALGDDPGTAILVPGVGAGDVRGGTHLLYVNGGVVWWDDLRERLEAYGPRLPVAAA